MMADEKPRCCKLIYKSDGRFRGRHENCKLTGKIQRDGKWYCGTHDPEAQKKRREKINERYNKKMESVCRDGEAKKACATLTIDQIRQIPALFAALPKLIALGNDMANLGPCVETDRDRLAMQRMEEAWNAVMRTMPKGE